MPFSGMSGDCSTAVRSAIGTVSCCLTDLLLCLTYLYVEAWAGECKIYGLPKDSIRLSKLESTFRPQVFPLLTSTVTEIQHSPVSLKQFTRGVLHDSPTWAVRFRPHSVPPILLLPSAYGPGGNKSGPCRERLH